MSNLSDQLKKFMPAAGDTLCDNFKKAAQMELEWVKFLKTIFVDENTLTDDFKQAYCDIGCRTTSTTTQTTTETTTSVTTTGTTTAATTTHTTTPRQCFVYSKYTAINFTCMRGNVWYYSKTLAVPYGFFSYPYNCGELSSDELSTIQNSLNANAEMYLNSLIQSEELTCQITSGGGGGGG